MKRGAVPGWFCDGPGGACRSYGHPVEKRHTCAGQGISGLAGSYQRSDRNGRHPLGGGRGRSVLCPARSILGPGDSGCVRGALSDMREYIRSLERPPRAYGVAVELAAAYLERCQREEV